MIKNSSLPIWPGALACRGSDKPARARCGLSLPRNGRGGLCGLAPNLHWHAKGGLRLLGKGPSEELLSIALEDCAGFEDPTPAGEGGSRLSRGGRVWRVASILLIAHGATLPSAGAEIVFTKWCSPDSVEPCVLPQATANLGLGEGSYVIPLVELGAANPRADGWQLQIRDGVLEGPINSTGLPLTEVTGNPPLGLRVVLTEDLCGALRPSGSKAGPFIAVCGDPSVPAKQSDSPVVIDFSLWFNNGESSRDYRLSIARGPNGLTPPRIIDVTAQNPPDLSACASSPGRTWIKIIGDGFISQTSAIWNAGGAQETLCSNWQSPDVFAFAPVGAAEELEKLTVLKNAGTRNRETTSNPIFSVLRIFCPRCRQI